MVVRLPLLPHHHPAVPKAVLLLHRVCHLVVVVAALLLHPLECRRVVRLRLLVEVVVLAQVPE